MAIIDDRSELGTALALNTGAPGTYNLGDTIDLQGPPTITGGNNTRSLPGAFLVVMVSTAATSGGAATLQLRLVSDESSTPSTSTATVHAMSGPIPLASLAAGRMAWCVSVDGMPSAKRYLGLQQITGGTAFTGGAVSMFFTDSPSLPRSYADNVA